MSIRAHCPSCQTEYTLVDSLRGKYVRCDHYRQSFRAGPLRVKETRETAPPTALPTLQLTPPSTAGPPLTVLNSDEPRPTPAPRPRPRPRDSGGVSKAGFPLGIVVLVCFAIRACTSLTSTSTTDSSRWKPPSPAPIKPPDNLKFRL